MGCGIMSAMPMGDTERLARIEAKPDHMATREDLANLEAKMPRIEARLEHVATRKDLTNFEARMLRWVTVFLMFGTVSLIIGVTRTLI